MSATTKPPALRTFLARVIARKSGERNAGRQEVAAEVLHALQLAQHVCPLCAAEAYAMAPAALLCGQCRAPMQPADSDLARIDRFIARHRETLAGLAKK